MYPLFLCHLVTFGFQASAQLDSIILYAVYKKTDHSYSNFLTGIGVAVYGTVETECLISHTRSVIVNRIT